MLLLYIENVLRSIGKAYVESLSSGSVFLPDISFIVAIIASECIKRYWESICGQSK